jgi:hypothetical protein
MEVFPPEPGLISALTPDFSRFDWRRYDDVAVFFSAAALCQKSSSR